MSQTPLKWCPDHSSGASWTILQQYRRPISAQLTVLHDAWGMPRCTPSHSVGPRPEGISFTGGLLLVLSPLLLLLLLLLPFFP